MGLLVLVELLLEKCDLRLQILLLHVPLILLVLDLAGELLLLGSLELEIMGKHA